MAPDRYPKRLRKEIKYYDTDGEDDQEERVEAVDRSHDKAPKKKVSRPFRSYYRSCEACNDHC